MYPCDLGCFILASSIPYLAQHPELEIKRYQPPNSSNTVQVSTGGASIVFPFGLGLAGNLHKSFKIMQNGKMQKVNAQACMAGRITKYKN